MKVLFEGSRATGVLVKNDLQHTVTIFARKGVILAAGAVFTPQLLQLSGIGEASHLQRLGVPQLIANGHVGQNFVDRAILNLGVWASQHRPLYIGHAMSSNKTNRLTIESEGHLRRQVYEKALKRLKESSLGVRKPSENRPKTSGTPSKKRRNGWKWSEIQVGARWPVASRSPPWAWCLRTSAPRRSAPRCGLCSRGHWRRSWTICAVVPLRKVRFI